MPTSRWQVVVDARRHDVVARVGYWNARRTVEVDGRQVLDLRPRWLEAPTYWQSSTEHPFQIDGHPAALRVIPGRLNYHLDLVVDRTSIRTGRPAGELPPAKLTGRSRDDEALQRPITPETRVSWALRAVAIFLVFLGVTTFFVGTSREPFIGKAVSEAGALGLALAGLGGVVLGLLGRPRRSMAAAILGTWLVGVVLSIPVLMPPVERLRAVTWISQLIGHGGAAVVLSINLTLLFIPALGGVLVAIGGLLSLSDTRFRSVWAAVLGVASLAAGLISVLELADGSPLRWLDPTSTIAPHLLVLAAVTCVWVFATSGRYLPGSSPAIAYERQERRPQWTSAALLVGAVALGWTAAAPLVGPIDAPRLEIRAADTRSALDQARVRQIFDETRARTGLSGDGLAFAVVFEPRGQQQFGSTRELDGAGVRIWIDSQSDALRQERLLAYHFAGGLVDAVAYRGPHFSAGYAYWAAHNSLNPFVSSDAPGERADTCRQIPSLDLTAVNDNTFVPLSLPFVHAERGEGPRGAQDLMRNIAASPPSPEAWKQQVADACRALLESPSGP